MKPKVKYKSVTQMIMATSGFKFKVRWLWHIFLKRLGGNNET